MFFILQLANFARAESFAETVFDAADVLRATNENLEKLEISALVSRSLIEEVKTITASIEGIKGELESCGVVGYNTDTTKVAKPNFVFLAMLSSSSAYRFQSFFENFAWTILRCLLLLRIVGSLFVFTRIERLLGK